MSCSKINGNEDIPSEFSNEDKCHSNVHDSPSKRNINVIARNINVIARNIIMTIVHLGGCNEGQTLSQGT